MSASFSACELAMMQSTAESTLFDSCKLGTATAPDFGADPGVSTYAWGDEIACGFKNVNSREVLDGTQAPVFDARLRLPLDTVLDNIDRVCITKRFGVVLTTDEYYTIEGAAQRTACAITVNLKLIAGDTAL